MVYGPNLLPFWLTAVGFSLVFAGTGWALLKWTSRPITVRKWARDKSDFALPGDGLSDDSFGTDDLELVERQRAGSMRGVEAIFTTHDQKSKINISKTLLLGMIEIGVLLVIYTSLVREYYASLGMQSWVKANFAFGQYLLTYNAVLVATGLIGVISFSLLSHKKPDTRKSRKRPMNRTRRRR